MPFNRGRHHRPATSKGEFQEGLDAMPADDHYALTKHIRKEMAEESARDHLAEREQRVRELRSYPEVNAAGQRDRLRRQGWSQRDIEYIVREVYQGRGENEY